MKNKDLALLIAGIIFALVAILHLYRLTYQVVIFFGTYMVPIWVSLPGFIVALLLSIWMFVARSAKR